MKSPYSTLRHVTCMMFKCGAAELLNDLAPLEEHFRKSLEISNARIVQLDSHQFEPEGITIMAILADSHAVLHTWPEESFVMVEIFTCGKTSNPAAGIDYLVEVFKPTTNKIENKLMQL
jgi:S-adenosylmethionine decarboxylase